MKGWWNRVGDGWVIADSRVGIMSGMRRATTSEGLLIDEIERLQTICAIQTDLITWYETEQDRSCHDDESLPEELRELEEALRTAQAAGGE